MAAKAELRVLFVKLCKTSAARAFIGPSRTLLYSSLCASNQPFSLLKRIPHRKSIVLSEKPLNIYCSILKIGIFYHYTPVFIIFLHPGSGHKRGSGINGSRRANTTVCRLNFRGEKECRKTASSTLRKSARKSRGAARRWPKAPWTARAGTQKSKAQAGTSLETTDNKATPFKRRRLFDTWKKRRPSSQQINSRL